MISLDEGTWARLMECRARLELAVQRVPAEYPRWMRKRRVSLASVVAFLLDHRDNDLRRKADFDQTRRGRKGTAGPGGGRPDQPVSGHVFEEGPSPGPNGHPNQAPNPDDASGRRGARREG